MRCTTPAANPLVLTLPIGSEDNFQGVIDLVAMQAVTWDGEVRWPSLFWCEAAHPLLDIAGRHASSVRARWQLGYCTWMRPGPYWAAQIIHKHVCT